MTYEELTPEMRREFDARQLEIAKLRVKLAESNDSLCDPPRPLDHLERMKKELEEARQGFARWHDDHD